MTWRMLLGVLFALPAVAPAAPVPKSSVDPQLLKLFGTPVAPDKDCTFKLKDAALTIEVPAKAHTLTTEATARNAPRVLRDADGNFTATVRVTVTFPDAPVSDIADLDPASGAGLVIWGDDKNYVCLERVHQLLGGTKRMTTTELHSYLDGEDGASESSRPVVLDGTPVYLRVIRTGPKVRGYVSPDGVDWKPAGEAELNAVTKVKVGVFAGHNAGKPVTATLDKFEVK